MKLLTSCKSRLSGENFICPKRTGNMCGKRAWTLSTAMEKILSPSALLLLRYPMTASRLPCVGTPYSLPSTPAPAAVGAALKNGTVFPRDVSFLPMNSAG